MKYFHTITPISDERRENRKNEIDAYINDIKKQLFSLYCEKASMDIKAEDYVGKKFKFKFNFNPYHTRGWVTTTLQDFFSVEKSELYKLEEISD